MKKIWKDKKRIILIVITILVIVLLSAIVIKTDIIKKIADIIKASTTYSFTWKTTQINEEKATILIKVENPDGIEQISYLNEKGEQFVITCNGKKKVSLDYNVEDAKSYEFKVKLINKIEKTEIINYEIPSIKGDYTNVNGIYANKPDLTGYKTEYTRYLTTDEQDNLKVGNWINKEAPNDWYDYKNSKWANIYIENNGIETYYVWIPRYCFKLDQLTQRSDVKFINTRNEYIDAQTGQITSWKELREQGYQIPEAFSWVNEEGNLLRTPGYWTSKYTLGDLSKYIIDYSLISTLTSIAVKELKINTSTQIVKYTYAINGQIVNESATAEDYDFTTVNMKELNMINITALNANGEIVGSMTKEYSPTQVNSPDLAGFNKDTTFYVTYDENGIEYNDIPITQAPPENWYEYGASMWANIVTRNNGQETYYVWIPRYEFKLDQISQRSSVKFLKGTSTDTSYGYQIPEAFTWINEKGEIVQISGYWTTKYTLGTEIAPRFDSELIATSNSIKTKPITGTQIGTDQKYMYYIDGQYKNTKTNASETYEYTGLEMGKQYTINIIVRDNITNEYKGAITKQIKTIEANKPVLTGFKEDITYYVTYDQDGNEQIGDKIRNDGSNSPTNWYDYSTSKWANIVVKTQNATTYYTWIPRYEFNINASQYAQPGIGRTDVRFINGTGTQVSSQGYQIPEAFSWINEKDEKIQLPGYWVSKYTLGE